MITTRERELLALLASRDTKPDEIVNGSIELGLLLISEHRLDEADKRFQKLEGEQFDKAPLASRSAGVAGRARHAGALARPDQKDAAERSNELFVKVINDPFPKFGGKFDKFDKSDKVEKGYQAVAGILIRHADLAQAVADALNRNAAALGKANPPAL